MLIGYVRVSKSDGTQTLAPQRDAMLAAQGHRVSHVAVKAALARGARV